MNEEIKKKIINETVETIIDSMYEVTQEYMYNSEIYSNDVQEYEESNNEFVKDQEKYVEEVIKELYKRIKK